MKRRNLVVFFNLLERPFGQLYARFFCAFYYLLFLLAALTLSSMVSCVKCLSDADTDGPEDFKLKLSSPDLRLDGGFADVFVFNDDALARLDSYQRFTYMEGATLNAASTSGGRIVVAVVTPDADKISWAAMNSYSALLGREADLRDEDPSSPVLSGQARMGAASGECGIVLRPLLAKVVLRSISCDFSGRTYAGERLRNARVYLTNVSSRCRIIGESPSGTTSFMNSGGLCASDVNSLRCPGMLEASLPPDIGWDVIRTDIELFCYENTNVTESAGTAFTRLVIEGEVAGRTLYWPINLNRGEFAPVHGEAGIMRACTYVLDVSIFRLGTDNPDTPVSPASVSLECSVVPWSTPEEILEPF